LIVRKSPILEVKNIHKWFGKIHAVNGANLIINPSEIVGLVGDNGAGKSTLIKVISGYYFPDEGEIFLEGRKVKIKSPSEARYLKIVTVYQDQALVDQMSIVRNIFMGEELVRCVGFLDKRKMVKESMRVLKEMGLTSIKAPNMPVGVLSGGEREGVAISRAMYFKAKLVILDEPTIGLSLKEAERVLEFVRGLREKGVACIFITHNLYYVYPIANRFVIMKRGKTVKDVQKKNVTIDELSGITIDD